MAGKIIYGMWRVNKEINSPEKQVKLLHELLELGITTIDTADIYGSEHYGDAHKILGAAFALEPELKTKFKVITKCGIIAREKSTLPYYNNQKEYIMNQVKKSLAELNLTSVDTLLLHRPDLFMDFEQVYEAFKELKSLCLVKQFGVSNYTPEQFKALNKYLSKRGIGLITNQIEINPFTTEHFDNDNVYYLKGEEIRPMIWSPYAGGALFEKNEIATVVAQIAQEYQLTNSEIVIAYLNNQGLNPDIILGTQKIERYELAVRALDIKLAAKDMYRILKACTKIDVR